MLTEDQVFLEEPASSTGTLSSFQNLDKDLSFTDQFFVEKTQEEEPGKTNAEVEVSKVVDEIVTNAVDWAMQAPLQARFKDLPTVDMKEIRQQRMFDDNTYKSHEVHNDLYEALQKSVEVDYSNQHLADQEEARKKKRRRCESPRTPPRSPPIQPPPPPPLIGASGALGCFHFRRAEERPATPEPAWTIPSSNKSDVVNNWASASATTYEPPVENSLLAKIGDMTTFMNWYCQKIDWTNPEGDQVRINVNQPLPLGGHLGHVTIQPQFFFNKHFEYLRYGSKGSNLALSISKMKAASYPDFGLELLVPEQMWIDDVLKLFSEELTSKNIRLLKKISNLYPSDFEDLNLLLLQGHLDHLPGSDKQMLSTAVKLWTQNLVIRQRVEDFQLGIESYQTPLNLTKPRWDATGYEFKHAYTIDDSPRAVIFPVTNNERKIMRFNEIYKFSDGTLTHILEALDYRVNEFKIKRLNSGMNTRFWTVKDVIRSNEFLAAIERRLKTRRIYQNLECFIGGHVRNINYRLLQRTE
ncbi:hypothetical protein Tco_0922736 [Tanacetum coccineum]|uniref:Uncharacterized protein n=1 Tax=Tanacetum coccineum TaxID=301880 RepID=A0ABQ5D0H6_9ASTR